MRLSSSHRARLLEMVGVGLLLTFLWFFFFWRVLTPVNEDRLIFDQSGDFVLHFYAPIAYQVERVQAGEFPDWNPYNYGGEPSAANIQNGTFYPPRYLGVALTAPGEWTFYVYQLEIALHYLLASLLMYAFLRVLLGSNNPTASITAALFGAVTFAYSGYLTGYAMLQGSIVETATWIPLALLGVHLSVTRPRWRLGGALIAALAVALMLLAGRPQAALHLVYLTMAYLVIIGWKYGHRIPALLWRVLLVGGLGLALAFVQLWPMLEFSRQSFRVLNYRESAPH